ncbi:hypothetical protein ACFFIA_30485 [Phytohabitans kaempferiae]|uniref:Uncharacterized protein n=1 Tax=Phytohabitans kaempferiae TaxID=1620943 RepID=A0ABV6MB85_9ACTN
MKWQQARAADNLDAYVRTMLVRTYVDERRPADDAAGTIQAVVWRCR